MFIIAYILIDIICFHYFVFYSLCKMTMEDALNENMMGEKYKDIHFNDKLAFYFVINIMALICDLFICMGCGMQFLIGSVYLIFDGKIHCRKEYHEMLEEYYQINRGTRLQKRLLSNLDFVLKDGRHADEVYYREFKDNKSIKIIESIHSMEKKSIEYNRLFWETNKKDIQERIRKDQENLIHKMQEKLQELPVESEYDQRQRKEKEIEKRLGILENMEG